jgi:Domain of unknown function (DUF4268)
MADRSPGTQQSQAAVPDSPMIAAVGPTQEDFPGEGAPDIGKIERVPLREVWKHEAHNLTTWLEENVDVLNDVLGLSLVSADREQAAGAFNVDLIAEDESGRTVIIENQLERSNHDHLGKLITYTAMTDAHAAIWVVSDPRPEHVRAISWLNDSSPSDFYLLKIEGIRIAESPPAPLLTLIVGPSEEGRRAGEVKKEIAEGGQIRRRFWTQLLENAKQRTKLHGGVSPTDRLWSGTGAGKGGLSFNYTITQHDSGVELYIDRGRDSEDNRRIFDSLAAHKDEIENIYQGRLEWQPLEGKRACRIRQRFELGGYQDKERWPEIQDKMIDAMVRLERALKPHIARLTI